MIVGVLALVAVAAIAAALYFALRGSSSNSNSSKSSSGGFEMRVAPAKDRQYNRLPGVRRTKAPWPPEFAHLDGRLAPLGLQALSQEALAYHIHQHLDIFLNGKRLAVPPYVGFCCPPRFTYLTELHTHSSDGVIHNESETKSDYTLGQFFAEWGLFLNKRCVGGYCQGFKWYVNGKQQHGNPQDLVLKAHLEVVLAIGTLPTKIPSTYAWGNL
jgi:hypothetical protein